jgi:acyl carrier protein
MDKPSRIVLADHPHLSIAHRITAMVREKLAGRGFDRPVSYDDDLLEIGLSSLDMVNLMLQIEAVYDLQIPDADMMPENFRSVARIEKLLTRLRGTS